MPSFIAKMAFSRRCRHGAKCHDHACAAFCRSYAGRYCYMLLAYIADRMRAALVLLPGLPGFAAAVASAYAHGQGCWLRLAHGAGHAHSTQFPLRLRGVKLSLLAVIRRRFAAPADAWRDEAGNSLLHAGTGHFSRYHSALAGPVDALAATLRRQHSWSTSLAVKLSMRSPADFSQSGAMRDFAINNSRARR